MTAEVLMATPSWPLPALSHWEVEAGGTRGREEVRGAKLAGRWPPFLGRERAAVSVDVDPARRSPAEHVSSCSSPPVKLTSLVSQ
ncbi:MAG: hypothetical protein ACPIOQ_26425, partial [Promethearchaeia archaeon]